jgi:hypothetical protein
MCLYVMNLLLGLASQGAHVLVVVLSVFTSAFLSPPRIIRWLFNDAVSIDTL